MTTHLAIKIDVDTDRGTRIGALQLARFLKKREIPATYFFSLGPDNTGKAIRRAFRSGFIRKVGRTAVVKNYGIKTLFYGTLLPAPHIGQRNGKSMQEILESGFEVGIHCYDHFRWQDYVRIMPMDSIGIEFEKATQEFKRIFGFDARYAGAPGWQTCRNARRIYDGNDLDYSSDTRGVCPYYPIVDDYVSKTLEIPTTLPTLDELIGRKEFPIESIPNHYCSLLYRDGINVLTIHAEIEGMAYLILFRNMLDAFLARGVEFLSLGEIADEHKLGKRGAYYNELKMKPIDGRSGLVATQTPDAKRIDS